MINWFPGHMAKGIKNIKSKQKFIDLFIILLDARAPNATFNHEFDNITKNKKRLFILTKSDLADINQRKKFVFSSAKPNDEFLFVNLKAHISLKKILKHIENNLKQKRIKDQKKGMQKSFLKIMILGIPNLGKSTLINLLSKSSKTKTGNIPGVTRSSQWVVTKDFYLLDTPGILWPKIHDDLDSYKLLLLDTIKTSIFDPKILFLKYYQIVTQYYPRKIIELNLSPSNSEEKIKLELIKYCHDHNFQKNNKLDLDRGRIILINYFKKLKGVTYE